jgi:hypothetical protein
VLMTGQQLGNVKRRLSDGNRVKTQVKIMKDTYENKLCNYQWLKSFSIRDERTILCYVRLNPHS